MEIRRGGWRELVRGDKESVKKNKGHHLRFVSGNK